MLRGFSFSKRKAMSKVVFILGAGASRQCGAPLMGDFLDTANDLLRSRAVEDKKEKFEIVFNAIGALQAVHSKAQLDLNNLESIFTVLELGKVIQRIPGTKPEEITMVISALKEVIVKTLETKMVFPYSDYRPHAPAPYDSFAKLVKSLETKISPCQSCAVITFNYDLAADLALQEIGFGPDYRIDGLTFSSHPIPLLKLHGSLNWATEIETNRILPLHLNNYFSAYNWTPFGQDRGICLTVGAHLKEYFSRKEAKVVNEEPLIIPPSWNKADYHSALSDVWAMAAKHLSEAEYIFIIGYSLPATDSFFRHLYALGCVGDAPLRKIAVFNPDSSGETEKRFRELLGPGAAARFEYHQQTFANSISTIRSYFPKEI
jgi:hypothetical protein